MGTTCCCAIASSASCSCAAGGAPGAPDVEHVHLPFQIGVADDSFGIHHVGEGEQAAPACRSTATAAHGCRASDSGRRRTAPRARRTPPTGRRNFHITTDPSPGSRVGRRRHRRALRSRPSRTSDSAGRSPRSSRRWPSPARPARCSAPAACIGCACSRRRSPSGLPMATNRSRDQFTEIAAWLLSVCCTQKCRF